MANLNLAPFTKNSAKVGFRLLIYVGLMTELHESDLCSQIYLTRHTKKKPTKQQTKTNKTNKQKK